jgi:putative phosphoesterase
MRAAALFDIHGNVPALEAVLDEVRQANVHMIVAGGDVVVGPMSREALALLLDLDIPVQFIYGNCEVAVLEQLAGRVPAAVPEPYRPVIEWTANELVEYQPVLAAWPMTCRLEIEGVGDVLFCHATPRNENEGFTRLTAEERLLPVFAGVDSDVVVCGHTHMQFDRMIGRIRVVNAGSVGMPWGQPGADWLLLGPDVELRHTSYDLARAAERIGRTSYPQIAPVLAGYMLQPPSEAQMLDAYSRAEIRS